MNCAKTRSILIIDDDDALRRSIVGYLEDTGFLVHQAAGGQEGISMFQSLQPDLVLTDLMMPEMDGLGVVAAIRKDSPDTPVVIISGNGSVSYAIETVRQGAWDYITKPIHDFALLEQLINRVFVRSEEQQTARKQVVDLEQSVADYATRLKGINSFDPLTGLPAKQRLQELFTEAVVKTDFSGHLFLLLLDLDNLKSVNKTLGHEFGDKVLVETAIRLRELRTESRSIGRLGADQFVIMVTDCNDVHTCITTLRQMFATPFNVGPSELFITGCTGIAVFPNDGESLDSLLQNANAALSQAKQLGTNKYAFFSQELGERLRERMSRESLLHRALERNEFFLEYQPKLSAQNGRICGMEALLRWLPTGCNQIISPIEFIPILEELGLIVDVGNWVLETACHQLKRWQQNGAPPLQLSVNISAVQFHAGDLPDSVASILERTAIDPVCLCLELTESIVMRDIDQTITTLEELCKLGVQLSIDDFGTGYSSLTYLQRMPLHELKIDRSFVMNLPEDKSAIAIVNSVLALAESLDLTVVAEGVENQQQADFLTMRQCHQLQGYLFSRPLGVDAFTTYLGFPCKSG
jgi:diguanylate cyclase (GGDEF)-like protein